MGFLYQASLKPRVNLEMTYSISWWGSQKIFLAYLFVCVFLYNESQNFELVVSIARWCLIFGLIEVSFDFKCSYLLAKMKLLVVRSFSA